MFDIYSKNVILLNPVGKDKFLMASFIHNATLRITEFNFLILMNTITYQIDDEPFIKYLTQYGYRIFKIQILYFHDEKWDYIYYNRQRLNNFKIMYYFYIMRW